MDLDGFGGRNLEILTPHTSNTMLFEHWEGLGGFGWILRRKLEILAPKTSQTYVFAYLLIFSHMMVSQNSVPICKRNRPPVEKRLYTRVTLVNTV